MENLRAEAENAMRDGVPDVAVEKFRRCLQVSPASERAAISLSLAQAFIAAGRAPEALDVLQNADPRNGDVAFAKAQALAAAWRWSEALPLFEKAAARAEFALPAKLAQAEALHALNRTPEAIAILESLGESGGVTAKLRLADFYLDSNQSDKCASILKLTDPTAPTEKKWAACTQGRLLLLRGRAASALPLLQGVIRDTRDVPESLLVAVTLAITDATLAMSGPEQADNVIEDFVWRYPQSMYFDPLFRRLDQIYAMERNPSESELQKWASQKPERRASFAQFYLAKLQVQENKTDSALELLGAFVKHFPDHVLAGDAYFLAGKIHFDAQHPDEALMSYEAAMLRTTEKKLLGEIEIAAGRARFAQQEFVLAANLFRSAVQHAPALAETALFDSALAWLHQGNYERFLDDYKELSARFPESETRRELILEEGLLQARAGDARAEKTLKLFIRDFPENQRVSEARLALAEIAFASRDHGAAGAYLKAAYETPHTESDSERAAYLAIFLADAPDHRDDQKTIELCRKFIAQNAGSNLLSDVRMKLGQVYFRLEDFANAQTLFETLANEDADSPLAENALFLAGQSAMKTMNPTSLDHAIELFESVAKLNGPLKLYARQEQAIAKSKAGKESEALIIYNDILGSNPDDELKFAVMCGKGDALFAMGNGGANFFEQAIAAFGALDALPGVPVQWRNQALYKKGKCHEKLGRISEALVAFYDVLNTKAVTTPEYLWYYKAGFDAARLLEAQQQWKSAIGIYQKIASIEGPRAQEAKTRALQLRLEHFIWED